MVPNHITILGGGPAGLAAGYYARKSGLPFTLHEAKPVTGGNAITLRHGDFRFDSGAHRFHDKDPHVTRDLRELLGSELIEVSAPSRVYYRGKLIEFPLTAGSLATHLGFSKLLRAAAELAMARLKRPDGRTDFESTTLRMYGRTVAEEFLLNYSEKLWGLPARQLSPTISGSRLAQLSALALLRDTLFGARSGTRHLEGRFLYPQDGYGEIVEALARACGPENVRTDSPAQSIQHDGARIQSIRFGGEAEIPVQTVINTIPLPLFLRIMDPAPPDEIISVARGLRFRNVIVVAIFLDQERVGQSASLYFPARDLPFTRMYEPKNRSPRMAPTGKTSLCAEYPCFPTDSLWGMPDRELIEMTAAHVDRLGLVSKDRVLDGAVVRLNHAYPVLEAGIEGKISRLIEYLNGFSNLRSIGRNGRFVYAHVHDMLRFGLEVIADLEGKHQAATADNGVEPFGD